MRVQPFSFLEQVDTAVVYDPDAEAFFTAAGITDTTQKNAVNQLVLDLKADSIWSKGIALYPFVGGTSSTHSYNLIDPTTYQLSYSGGITHSSTGIKGNGSTGRYDTDIPLNVLDSDSASIAVYSRDNNTNGVDMGVTAPTVGGIQTNLRNGASNHTSRAMSDPVLSTSSSNSALFGGVSRQNSTTAATFLNKSKTSFTNSSSPIGSSLRIFGMCVNTSGGPVVFSSREQGLSWIGEGLTNTDIDNFVDINETYQTALGRFV